MEAETSQPCLVCLEGIGMQLSAEKQLSKGLV